MRSRKMATRGNELFGLLKPAPFKITKVGDPEQTLLDWTKYIKTFRRFLRVSKVSGTHTEDHSSCEGCETEKDVLLMVGQDDVEMLWKHVGKVADEDSFETALKKIEEGITGQTN